MVDDVVKAAVERNVAVWKEVLGVIDKNAKDRCVEFCKEENKRLKAIYTR